MRSAKSFAREFTSVWRELTPTLDLFVRAVNSGLAHRRFSPLATEIAPQRRALVNETGFRWFAEVRNGQHGDWQAAFPTAFAKASAFLTRFESADHGTGPVLPLSQLEKWDARHQLGRLVVYFGKDVAPYAYLKSGEPEAIRLDYSIKGCGFVDSCTADAFVSKTLFEVKGGDRHFRAVDFKQVLTYIALNYQSGSESIDRVVLLNLRTGLLFRCSTTVLSSEVAGCLPEELIHQIRQRMSGGEISP